MFIRPELRKGDVDLRVKAPRNLVEKIDLISVALGVSRQEIVLVALDSYVTEALAVTRVLAPYVEHQRNSSGMPQEGGLR